jgi:quinol monooxygenase YgiN
MIFVADLHAHPHTAREVAGILADLARATAAEPGAVAYSVRRHEAEPFRFQVCEQYRDRQAWERHMAAPHVQAALARFAELLAAAPATAVYTEIAAMGG